jgi:hypothetical protein
MLAALSLPDAARVSLQIARRYSTATLKQDLLALWPAALSAVREHARTRPLELA